MNWAEFYRILDLSVAAQGYWALDLASVPTGPARLPSTGSEALDSALIAATGDPNWPQLARQLTTFSAVSGYAEMWLRRDKYELELVVGYYRNDEFDFNGMNRLVDGLWVNTQGLTGRLGQYTFKGSNLDKIVEFASSLASDSWQAKLANLVVSMAFSTTPSVVLLGIGWRGLSPDLVRQAEKSWSTVLTRIDQWHGAVSNPILNAGVIGFNPLEAHGYTQAGSLSLPKLNTSFALYSQ